MKKGWEIKTLGEIATLQRGFDLPTRERVKGKYPIISSSGPISWHNVLAVPGPGVATGRSGSIGNVFYIEDDFWPLNTALYVKNFHGNHPKFIFYLLQNFDLARFTTGAGVPTLNRNFVHSEKVLIVSLPEQQRIVDILDEAFEGIAKAKTNAEQNLKNARELFESHLQAVFSQRGEGWLRKRIDSVCESIIDCINKTAPKHNTPTQFKMIRTTNIRNGKINLDSVFYATEEIYKTWTRRQIPQRGDIILTREAPLGEVGMLNSDEKVFLGQRLVSYRADPTQINSRYLLFAFQSQDVQNQIHALGSGATVQHMRVPDSKNLKISVPSLKTQAAIVDQLESLQAETQRLESIYQRKIAALDELKKSLLHKAFSGEL